MLKITVLVVVGVLVLLISTVLIAAATKPDRFRVERSTTIDALPDRIFPLINDYRRWRSWSPYEQLDPAMQRDYSGAEAGEGAVYEWKGNSRAGSGRMTITGSSPEQITMTLDMVKPMACHNLVTYSLTPNNDTSTKVTWAMEGESNFPSKIFQVFMNMDTMVGSQFEQGLANLKAVVENEAIVDEEAVAVREQ